jgi:isohexenylglutaconyl-CoA hydratase
VIAMTELALPDTKQLQLRFDEPTGALHVTLARPEVKNAMSGDMIAEIEAVLDAVHDRREVRALVLRGAGGNFCAGGDIKDMAAARGAPASKGVDPIAVYNRRFGNVIDKMDHAPQVVIAVLEGAVLGGGLGLACVSDVAIALTDAEFGLPETGLGVPPAQIAPFLVRRLGISQAIRLAVTGARFAGSTALALGICHVVVQDGVALEREIASVLAQVRRCAPGAIAATKHIMLQTGSVELGKQLDEAAKLFAEAARGPEGIEGMTAFIGKRKPGWAAEPG